MIRNVYLIAALSFTALGVAACGGEEEEEAGKLDCAWLESENNCWAQALQEIESCLPPSSSVGEFDETNQVCTYGTGHVVNFAQALNFPIDPEAEIAWKFSVEGVDGSCMSWSQDSDGSRTSLTTSSGVVHTSGSMSGFSITCQDGKKYATTDVLGIVFGCEAVPGYATRGIDELTFSLLGAEGKSVFGMTDLFTCAEGPEGA